LWKFSPQEDGSKPLALKQVLRIPGAKQVMLSFFCYCTLEQTAALWSASYLTLHVGFSPDMSATMGSLFFLGITVGRAISGFVTTKLNDTSMIRLGFGIIAAGIILLLLPLNKTITVIGLLMVGFGCAPIYPCMMHLTPVYFGTERSQALMGIQTASAYVGTALMPPLFGLVANHISIALMSLYLLVMLVLMMVAHRKLTQICRI
jgi:fucose permease